MTEEKMLVEYEATDRDVIPGWFEREKLHHDWLLRVELEAKEGKLLPAD
jgi:hypothetical protein